METLIITIAYTILLVGIFKLGVPARIKVKKQDERHGL